jgi:hypothetical protein
LFGFGESGKKYEIDLLLKLRAYVFLKEEFPLTTPFIKYDKKTDSYRLRISVNNLLPVNRFIEGLKEDIEVISPKV